MHLTPPHLPAIIPPRTLVRKEVFPLPTYNTDPHPRPQTVQPKITVFEIAAKTLIPVQDVHAHLRQLRRAKLLNYTFRPLRVVK